MVAGASSARLEARPRRAPVPVQVLIFVMIFSGVAAFGVAVMRSDNYREYEMGHENHPAAPAPTPTLVLPTPEPTIVWH